MTKRDVFITGVWVAIFLSLVVASDYHDMPAWAVVVAVTSIAIAAFTAGRNA